MFQTETEYDWIYFNVLTKIDLTVKKMLDLEII